MKLFAAIIVLLAVFFATSVSAGDRACSSLELEPVVVAPDCRVECLAIVEDIADVIGKTEIYMVRAEIQMDGVEVAAQDAEPSPHVVLTVLRALGKAALKGVANVIQHVV